MVIAIRFTKADANKEIQARFPHIEATGKIRQRSQQIGLKCNRCRHTWSIQSMAALKIRKVDACIKCCRKQKKTGQDLNPNRLSPQQFAKQIRIRHSGTIKVIKNKFIGLKKPCKFKCDQGHKWERAAAGTMLAKRIRGCPICFKINKNLKDYDKRLQKIHGDNIIAIEPYISRKTKIKHKCKFHGEFIGLPANLLEKGINGKYHGCPTCGNNEIRKYSKTSINFIKQITNSQKHIRHAEHPKGEYSLLGASGKRYFVDGYDPKYNIVYEYHGDVWHGNPAVCKPDSYPNPFSNLTARELYKKTKRRERDIQSGL